MDQKQLEWALKILRDAAEGNLYGSLLFKIENGKITSVKTETTEKPPC